MPRTARSTSDQLTGGSHDVNPQTMVFSLQQGVADTTIIEGQALPIPRLPIRKGRSLVIELLKVEFRRFTVQLEPNGVTTVEIYSVTTDPTAQATAQAALADPRAIAIWSMQVHTDGAPVTRTNNQVQFIMDLTDEAGHGILVATDNLYFVNYSAGTGATNGMVYVLTYRFKDVSLEEYIGIVQSQQ